LTAAWLLAVSCIQVVMENICANGLAPNGLFAASK
jgi:hypothetical protein